MIDIKIQGSHDLAALNRALKEIADKELKRQLRESARSAAKDTEPVFVAAAMQALPKGGGLNVWVAGRLRATVLMRSAGVRVALRRRGADIRALNRGRIRHPTYGHRPWVTQSGPSGWLDRAAAGPAADIARRKFVAAVATLQKRIPRR